MENIKICPNCSGAMKHLVPGLYICENCIPDDSPEGLNERFAVFDICDRLDISKEPESVDMVNGNSIRFGDCITETSEISSDTFKSLFPFNNYDQIGNIKFTPGGLSAPWEHDFEIDDDNELFDKDRV